MHMCKPSMPRLIWLYYVMDQGLFWMALQFVQASFLFYNHYHIIDSLSLSPVICLEAPLSMSQSSLPWVMLPMRADTRTYSSSLEEYSLSYLDLFLDGSSSSTAWAWCLFLRPFCLWELLLFLGQSLAKCPFSSHVWKMNLDLWWLDLCFLDCTMRAWSSLPIFSSRAAILASS